VKKEYDPPMDEEALEREILLALEGGDLALATTKLLRGFGPGILGYLHAVARDPHAADEAFAQFGEELSRSLGGSRRESCIKTAHSRRAATSTHPIPRSSRPAARRASRSSASTCTGPGRSSRFRAPGAAPPRADSCSRRCA